MIVGAVMQMIKLFMKLRFAQNRINRKTDRPSLKLDLV